MLPAIKQLRLAIYSNRPPEKTKIREMWMNFGLLWAPRPWRWHASPGMMNPRAELNCSDHLPYRCSALNFPHWLTLKGQWVRFILPHNRKWLQRYQQWSYWSAPVTQKALAQVLGMSVREHFKRLGTGEALTWWFTSPFLNCICTTFFTKAPLKSQKPQ